MLTFFVIELVQCDGSVLIDRTVEFCCFAIYTARYNVTGESRRNALGDLKTSYALPYSRTESSGKVILTILQISFINQICGKGNTFNSEFIIMITDVA